MERHLIKWLINTIAIMLAIKLVPGIGYKGEWWGVLLVGLIFGIVNTLIRPVVKLLTLPFLVVTLGLFTFITNAMMLSATSWISTQFRLGFYVEGFKAAFIGALIISLVSLVISCLLPSDDTERVHIQIK
ncbi:MAG: phage holin family protein [Thermodesulfovibrionales bacterium]